MEAVQTVQSIADHLSAQSYSNTVVGQVLALKFSSNELLLRLVAEDRVRETPDQRDLLAFTKMEGSSYRCFREVYAKAHLYNRSAALEPA
jgi:hypothetical protein